MTRVRRALTLIAAAWLLLHGAIVAAAPLLIWQMASDSAEAVCTCPHTGEAACPMHHRPTNRGVCVMRSVQTNGAAAMHTMFDTVGFRESPSHVAVPVESACLFAVERANALARPSSPDAPPPRA